MRMCDEPGRSTMITKPTHGDPTRVGTAGHRRVQSPVCTAGRSQRHTLAGDPAPWPAPGPLCQTAQDAYTICHYRGDLRCGPLGRVVVGYASGPKLAVHLLCVPTSGCLGWPLRSICHHYLTSSMAAQLHS